MAKKPVEVYNTSVLNSYAEWLRETKNNCREAEQDQAHFQNRPSKRTSYIKGKGKVHPCTDTEALYRPYGAYGE
jgi:hypothetical protein